MKVKQRLLHIHIPQSGGTWLNHNLHRCFAENDDWIISPIHQSALPEKVVSWEWNWLPPPAMKVSGGILRNCYTGDIGHRSVEELSRGCADDLRFADGIQILSQRLDEFGGRTGHRWWNPTSGIGDKAMRELFICAKKISVCRNPYDLMFSRWNKALRQGDASRLSASSQLAMRTLEGFLEIYFEHDEIQTNGGRTVWKKDLFGQMYYEDGSCGIDVILRNETLSAGLEMFLSGSGLCPADHPAEKIEKKRYRDVAEQTPTIPKPDYRLAYTPKTIDLIEKHCAFELKAFGYDLSGRISPTKSTSCDCTLPNASDDLFAHTCLRKAARLLTKTSKETRGP
jgi:hypothetical protein